VITTECTLRDLLGLPAADGRRTVPVTAPTETRLKPDCDESRAAMLANHPAIVRSRAIFKAAVGDVSRNGWGRLKRSNANHEQLIDQQTQSLKRFFLEIDANYKQFKTASKLRVAAAQRLDAQRVYFEAGRNTIDRFLE
jgi:hypothetical protein